MNPTTKEDGMTRMTPHTLHTRLVAEAMTRNGWTLSEDAATEYASKKRATRQLWTRPSRWADDSERQRLTVTVWFNTDGHVTGYSDADGGYADTHDEGRHHGAWRKRFTPRMCRDLLIDNADTKCLTSEDADEARRIRDEKFAAMQAARA